MNANRDGKRHEGRRDINDRRGSANLSVLFRDSVKDGPIGALRVTALKPTLFIVFISFCKSFWSEVVGVAKRLVDALERVPAGHENLEGVSIEVPQQNRGDGIPAQRP